jgi:enoyl-CoA hydratase
VNEEWNLELKDHVALLTINRPKSMNALNTTMCEELEEILTNLEKNPEVRVLIITGAGEKSFIAGADIDQMPTMTPEGAKYLIDVGHKVFAHIENVNFPVIAAINGYALGGGLELALRADIRICSKNAKFGLPEIKLGVIAGWGGPAKLAGIVGVGRTTDMLYTGKFIKSDKALEYGLVTEIFESVEELQKGALALAREIAEKPPITMAINKKMMESAEKSNFQPNPQADALALAYCFTTQDTREGVNAFIEKRAPKFIGM